MKKKNDRFPVKAHTRGRKMPPPPPPPSMMAPAPGEANPPAGGAPGPMEGPEDLDNDGM